MDVQVNLENVCKLQDVMITTESGSSAASKKGHKTKHYAQPSKRIKPTSNTEMSNRLT